MIKYIVYGLDENHLAYSETISTTEKRIVLREIKLKGYDSNSFDSIEEAVSYLKEHKMYYREYVFLPRVYLID